MTGDWILSSLRYAFLAGLLVLIIQAVRAVAANLALQPAPPRRQRVLAVEEPERLRGQEFAVSGEGVIGRAPTCAIHLKDDHVSLTHARVFERGGTLWVEDLKSTNGTLLNGQSIRHAAPLHAGDRLTVGTIVLTLREGGVSRPDGVASSSPPEP